MTPENFCYWLNGFIEISNSPFITADQVKIIKDHLDLVFNKVTPNRNIDSTELFKKLIEQNKDDICKPVPLSSPYLNPYKDLMLNNKVYTL